LIAVPIGQEKGGDTLMMRSVFFFRSIAQYYYRISIRGLFFRRDCYGAITGLTPDCHAKWSIPVRSDLHANQPIK